MIKRGGSMKTGMFIWQFDVDYPAAGGPPSDDQLIPIDFAFVKALNGPDFMRNFDSSEVAIESPDGGRRVFDAYASQGIGMVPWGVALAPSAESAQLEGARAGAVAQRVQGCYMIDLEDGPGYFQGDRAAVLAWLQSFKNAGGTEVWLCPDSRQQHLNGIVFDQWLADPIVTRVWPQCYWTDFQTSVERAMHDTTQPLLDAGVSASRIWPVFPANADPDDLQRAITLAASVGFPGFALWRRGTLSEGVARKLAELPQNGLVNVDTTPPPPAAVPPQATAPATPADVQTDPPTVTDTQQAAEVYDTGWRDAVKAMQAAIDRAPLIPLTNPYRA